MNRTAWIVLSLLLLGASAWLGVHIAAQHELATADAGTRYTCAMHPQVHSDHPGNCPICGMKLIREQAASAPPAALYWYDPMRPDQHFDQPGKSPFMDMQLVPKYADQAAAPGSVSIDPRMAQNLGIRLARVERARVTSLLHAAGAIAADDTRIEAVQARAAGWVEQLPVRAAGDAVRRGQLLAQLYAPDLLAAQEEFLLALRAQDASLTQSARARLGLLGVDAAQISRIEKTGVASPRIALHSPINGVVQELGVRLGQQVMPGATLFTLADLSSVWLVAEVPEAQAAQVHVGDIAVVHIAGLSDGTFTGPVDYIYPALMAETRSLRLRVILPNPKMQLRPGMYASADLSGPPRDVLRVPSEALIRTGTRSVLIVADGETHYRPVEVVTGAEAGGQTEIISGVEEGASVVASGQFLIDSEANLNASLQRIGAGTP